MSTTTCGGPGHSEECLCDVVIGTPTPMNYLPSQVKFGDIIARHTGFDEHTATGADLATYFEALGKAYDMTQNMRGLDEDWLDGLFESNLRQRVAEQLRSGESIIDVPDEVGDSFARCVAAITAGQAHMIWTWGDFEWLEFEDAINETEFHSPTELARRFGLKADMAESLIELYGKRVKGRNYDDAPNLAAIIERWHELPMASLLQMVRVAGLDCNENTVAVARKRHRKKLRALGMVALAAMPLGLAACRREAVGPPVVHHNSVVVEDGVEQLP